MSWLRRIADRIVNGRYLSFDEADWVRELERETERTRIRRYREGP